MIPLVRVPCGKTGEELKRLLKLFWIVPKKGCKCDEYAALMDVQGPDWCEAHIDVIVGWMRDEAKARRIPFIAWGARLLVEEAIRVTRRKKEVA